MQLSIDQNTNFKNIGYIKSRRISKYLTQEIPYEKKNVDKFHRLIEINNKKSVSKRLVNLLEKAKNVINENKDISPKSLFAATLLLFRGNVHDYLNENPQFNFTPLLFKAIDNHDASTLEELAKIDSIDWNALDDKGDNILLRFFKKFKLNEKNYADFEACLNVIKDLPKGKFNVNYVNDEGDSALTCCMDRSPNLLKIWLPLFKDLDVNRQKYNQSSPIQYAIEHYNFELFNKILSHPKFNYKNIDSLISYIKEDNSCPNGYLYRIERMQDIKMMNKIKKIYEEQGTFTIDEIMNIVQYPNFGKFANMSFNLFNERLGHIIAQIYPKTPHEESNMRKIFEQLEQSNYYFNNVDCFQKTGLDKAIEADNHFVADLFRKHLAN